MKKIFDTSLRPGYINMAILLLRVSFGSFMLTHGIPKLEKLFSGDPIAFATILGMSPALSLAMAVFAEVVCAVLIILGLLTRLASIPLITTMAMAAFYVHAADPFAKKEMALLFLVVFTFLLITGAGKYSLDNRLR